MAVMDRMGHAAKVIETDHRSASVRRYFLVNAFLDTDSDTIHLYLKVQLGLKRY
jgi:hypothetical protein